MNKSILLPVDVSKNCWMSGKQCSLRSDAAFCSVWSGTALFAQVYLPPNLGKYSTNWLQLTLVLLNPDIPCFANSVDPDQLASEEANWSGSALFAIKYMNL